VATGGYYIDAGSLDKVIIALKKSKGGVRDQRMAYRNIAEDAGHYVKAHAPVYRGPVDPKTPYSPGRKAGRSSALPGGLRRSVKWGATIHGPWVSAGDESTPYIYVQEFGGTSFWHRQGKGIIRAANRRHASYATMGEWGLGQGGSSGHVIYKKERNRRGYFIWNVAYRLRSRIGEHLQENLSLVLQKHGIPYEMPANADIGITPQSWKGRAA